MKMLLAKINNFKKEYKNWKARKKWKELTSSAK